MRMKKLLTLVLLAASMLTVNAESRKWDFTSWSEATVANLNKGLSANFSSDAEALTPSCGWSDIEKANGTQAAAVKGTIFWEVKAQGDAAKGAQLCANDQPIAEFEGLLYVNTTARSLAITINKGDGYQGSAYLWTGSKQKNYWVIPNVKAGAKITLGVESHKTTEARGYELYIVPKGNYTSKGTLLKDPDGNTNSVPKTYVEQTWLVPEEGLTDTPNEDGTYDVLIYNTNGCHCYFITVDEGDNMGEARNVAWLHGGTSSADYTNRPKTGFKYTDINAATETVTDETLRSYDAVVLGADLTKDMPSYSTVESNIAYVPMVNLNANLFGYTLVGGEATELKLSKANDGFWTNLSYEEETSSLEVGKNISVTLPEKFAGDSVLARQGDDVAVHCHTNGAGGNYYLFVNSTSDLIGEYLEWSDLLGNFINEAANSKRSVTAAAQPTFSLAYSNLKTTVTIKCATGKSKIYYKVGDGEYTLYTAPIEMTEAKTITAYAESEGFLKSEEATKDVDIQELAKTPVVSVSKEDGKTTLTVSSSEEGAVLYYSFSGQTTVDKAAKYTDAIVVTEPGTISAFATIEGKLNSELAQEDFVVSGIPAVTDTISHFTANEADWFNNAKVKTATTDAITLAEAIAAGSASGSAKAVYYFGKNTWKYYSDEVDHTETSSVGEDSIVYKPDANAYKAVMSTTNTDWIIETQGQVVTGENNVLAGEGVYTGTAGYFADEAIDEIGGGPSVGKVDFGGKGTGDPYTMRVVSTVQFDGTFDVVTYLSNGGTSDLGIELQKSTDGNTWESVGNLNYSKTQRLFKKSRFHLDEQTPVYLRVAQVSGGSKGQLYDIYVIRTEGTVTGINSVSAAEQNVKSVETKKFFKDGKIYIKKGDNLYNAAGLRVE